MSSDEICETASTDDVTNLDKLSPGGSQASSGVEDLPAKTEKPTSQGNEKKSSKQDDVLLKPEPSDYQAEVRVLRHKTKTIPRSVVRLQVPIDVQYNKYTKTTYFLFEEAHYDARVLSSFCQRLRTDVEGRGGANCRDLAAIIWIIEFSCIKLEHGTAQENDYDKIVSYMRRYRSKMRFHDTLLAWLKSQSARMLCMRGEKRDVITNLLQEAREMQSASNTLGSRFYASVLHQQVRLEMEKAAEEWDVDMIRNTILLAIDSCGGEVRHDTVFKLLSIANAHLRFSLYQPKSWQLLVTEDLASAQSMLETANNIIRGNPKAYRPACYAKLTFAALTWRQAQRFAREAGAFASEVCERISTAVSTCSDAIALIKDSKKLVDQKHIQDFYGFLKKREVNGYF